MNASAAGLRFRKAGECAFDACRLSDAGFRHPVINRDNWGLPRPAYLHHYRCQVIVCPTLVDYAFELVNGVLRVLVLSQHASDLIVRYMTIDAVAAQQEPCTVTNIDRLYLDVYSVLDAKRTVNDIPTRKAVSLIMADPA